MAKDSVRFVLCLMRSHFFLLLAGGMRDSPPSYHLCSLSWRHLPQVTRALQAFVLLLVLLLQQQLHHLPVPIEQQQQQQQQQQHELDGQLFDRIIPVEIDSASKGQLSLMLGVNKGDNPKLIAAEFCKKHGLLDEYIPQIAMFVDSAMS